MAIASQNLPACYPSSPVLSTGFFSRRFSILNSSARKPKKSFFEVSSPCFLEICASDAASATYLIRTRDALQLPGSCYSSGYLLTSSCQSKWLDQYRSSRQAQENRRRLGFNQEAVRITQELWCETGKENSPAQVRFWTQTGLCCCAMR